MTWKLFLWNNKKVDLDSAHHFGQVWMNERFQPLLYRSWICKIKTWNHCFLYIACIWNLGNVLALGLKGMVSRLIDGILFLLPWINMTKRLNSEVGNARSSHLSHIFIPLLCIWIFTCDELWGSQFPWMVMFKRSKDGIRFMSAPEVRDQLDHINCLSPQRLYT